MCKRTVFTTISPLPAGVSREVVVGFLHDHVGMIDLNPLVVERHPIDPPPNADPYEKDCVWYSLTDKIDYLPGGRASGDISYTCAFHNLPNGVQTHCRAPLGVDIRDKWTLNGALPGEPPEPVELGLGAPATGLYIREDVDLRCNILMASFVKKTLKRSHATLVGKLVERAGQASPAGTSSSSSGRGTPSPGPAQTMSPPWTPPSHTSARAPAPRAGNTAHHLLPGGRRGTRRPPPQSGRPFVDSCPPPPVQIPPVRSTGPHQASTSYSPPSHGLPRSQAQFLAQCPPVLRVPTQAPHPPGRTSPPCPRPAPAAAVRPDPTCCPAPLRTRGPSVSSAHAQAQHTTDVPGTLSSASAGSSSSSSRPPSPATTTTTRGSRHSSELQQQHQHPDYPHLSPYSSAEADSSPDEPRTPPSPYAPGGPGVWGKGYAAELPAVDHPAVLRPGGMTSRLNGPFVAGLE